MIFQKNKQGNLEIKSKKATIVFDGVIKVNDVELEGAGEYEIGEVAIEGVSDSIYIFQIEDIVLGSVNFKSKIAKENNEKLSNADALLIRLDGKPSEAVETTGQIGAAISIYVGAQSAEQALKAAGATFEKVESLKLTKGDTEEERSYFIQIMNGNTETVQ